MRQGIFRGVLPLRKETERRMHHLTAFSCQKQPILCSLRFFPLIENAENKKETIGGSVRKSRVFCVVAGKVLARLSRYGGRMSLCLAHISALTAWRHARFTLGASPKISRAHLPRTLRASDILAFRESPLANECSFGEIHAEVSSRNGRASFAGVTCHCFPATHDAPLVVIDRGIVALSAEAMFLQLSLSCSLEQLTMLAFELCGNYSMSADGTSFGKARPATSVRKLQGFIGARSQARGAAKALRALRNVVDGAASPAEARLVILLCFGQTLGGYGFPLPELNRKVELTYAARKLTPSRFFVLDLYWRSHKLDVEYDSDAYHSNLPKIASDAARRNALQTMGFVVVTVTREQVASADLFDDVARTVAFHLGIRVRHSSKQWPKKRAALRRNLMACI